MTKKVSYAGLLAISFLLVARPGLRAQEAVAVITELKLNRGDVEIRLPGRSGPERPAVLQSLYPGTQIRASKDASAVILFTDGMKSVTVDEKNSPFEVKASPSKAGGSGGGVKQLAGLLLGKKRPPAYVPLATRGSAKPPTLLSPRNTKVITPAPSFQWMGMDRQEGTVKVFGPEGLIWTAENIALTQIRYPPTALSLKPGVEYYWTLEKKGLPSQKTTFKIVGPDESKTIQDGLDSLQQATGLSKTTLAILKAGLLISNEVFYEAREAVVEAVNADPDEPTLHFLLGEIYEKTGLRSLAAEEYGEAEFLLKQRP
jgi:hypothetical protein